MKENNEMIPKDPETGTPIDSSQIEESELTENQLVYKENILDHYKHPHNKKEVDNPTCAHAAVNLSCGDTINVMLQIQDDKVVDTGFSGKGCAISQASMSMLSEEIKGKSIAEIQKMGRADILEMLGIPIGIVRMRCALLGLRATQSAIEEYEKKK